MADKKPVSAHPLLGDDVMPAQSSSLRRLRGNPHNGLRVRHRRVVQSYTLGLRRVRRGPYLAPFDEPANPRILADLASHAEARGWDGMVDRVFTMWPHEG